MSNTGNYCFMKQPIALPVINTYCSTHHTYSRLANKIFTCIPQNSKCWLSEKTPPLDYPLCNAALFTAKVINYHQVQGPFLGEVTRTGKQGNQLLGMTNFFAFLNY